MSDKALRFCICDDDLCFVPQIRATIERIMLDRRSVEISEFNNGEDFLEVCEKSTVDAVFLDIDMPFMSGFEVAEILQKIKGNVLVVFITSHEDKVYQSWSYQPFWFVRKSCLSDLEVVVPKLIAKIDFENKKKNCLYKLKTENSILELDINTLTVVESLRHNVVIKFKDGTEKQLRCKISDIEN